MTTYTKFINNILATRGRFNCGDRYHERHHIIPRCLNGNDDENNLIDLYAHEHFIAHKLLAIENPNNDKLIYAWHMMAFVKDKKQDRYELSPEEYEEVKQAFSKIHGKIVSAKLKRHKVSAETRIKISENHNYAYGEDHPMFGRRHTESAIEKMRQAAIGRPSSRRNRQQVYCVELDKIFEDATAVAKELSLDSGGILKCCKGERKTCGGYHWEFVNEETLNLENNIY